MSDEVNKAHNKLKDFMFEAVYLNKDAKCEEGKAKEIVKILYTYFINHPGAMPEYYYNSLERYGIERVVCDYVAGMTDLYAVQFFKDIYIPKTW